MKRIDEIISLLRWDFGIFAKNPVFYEARGVGKVGATGFLLGIIGGMCPDI